MVKTSDEAQFQVHIPGSRRVVRRSELWCDRQTRIRIAVVDDDTVLLFSPVRMTVPVVPAQVVHQDRGVALVAIRTATHHTTQQPRATTARRHRAPASPLALMVRPRRRGPRPRRRRRRRRRPRAPKTPRTPLLPHSLVLRIERRRAVPGNSSSSPIAAGGLLGVPAGIAVAEDGGEEAHEQRLAARQAGADEAGVGLDG